MKSTDLREKNQREVYLNDTDIVTKEVIEIEVPEKKQRVRLTLTRKRFYDPVKQKIITESTVHRARFSLSAPKN